MVLSEDATNGLFSIYGIKPHVEKNPLKRLRNQINKTWYDNVKFPMKVRMWNLSCFLFGHHWKLMFKPDFRKHRKTTFMFYCDRCCSFCDLILKKVIKEKSRKIKP
jgi:hypothetical protein